MSKLIGITNNYALAFGFSWKPIEPLVSESAQRKQLMDQGMLWEASFTLNKEEYIGVSAGPLTPYKGVTIVAGAAQIALHPRLKGQTALVILEEQIEGAAHNEIAVVGLINGNIVIDDYVSTEAAKNLRIKYTEMCRRTEKAVVVVGKSYTQGPVVEEYNWSDFCPSGRRKLFGKAPQLPAVLVHPLEPKIPPRLVWGTIAVLGVLGAVWGYTAYEAKEAARKAAEAERARANSGPIRYKQSVAELLAQPVWPANAVFYSLREQLREIPSSHEGWKFKEIVCTPDAGCDATRENTSGLSTYRRFLSTAPAEWGKVTLNNTGHELTHHMPVKLPTKPLPAQEKWLDERTFLVRPFSQWQRYWVVQFHPELDKTAKVAGVPDGLAADVAANYPDAIWAIKWSIDKTSWYLSEGFDFAAEKLDGNLPDSVTVEKIVIKFDGNQVNFDAEGKVYVRK